LRETTSQVIRVNNKVFSSNTYLCRTKNPDECLLIDPGLDPEAIDATMAEQALRPIAVLSTHGHFDHMGSASFFREKYQIPFYLPQSDLKIAKSAAFLLMACRIKAKVVTPPIDHPITAEEWFPIAGCNVRFVQVPGHTPGSCFIEYEGSLFTGDSLYAEGVGLVDFPGEDQAVLKTSLLKIWDFFDEALTVYPGHGRSNTLGHIKANNKPLRRFLGFEPADESVPAKTGTVTRTGDTLSWEPS